MSRVIHRALIAGGTALGLLICGPALAQMPSVTAPPPADSMLSGLEITAPRTIERTRYGVLVQEVSMSVRVSYSDLDMRTPAGAAELDRRVREAAGLLCRRLEIAYPNGSPERFYCIRDAVGDAEPQLIQARNAG